MAISDEATERRRFALQVFDHLTAAGIKDARYDDKGFRLLFDGGRRVLDLGPIHRRLRDCTPEQWRKWAADELPALLSGGARISEWDRIRPLLRPVLRRWTLRLADPEPRIRRPLQPPLDEVVVADLGDGTIDYPSPDRLEQWGVTEEEVFEIARQNLAATIPLTEPAVGPDSSIVLTGDYLPACPLLPDWFAYMTRDFEHRPVVFVPDSRTLILVDSAEEQLAEHYRRAEQMFRDSTDPLSPQGYVSDANGRLIQHAELAGSFVPAQRARRTIVTAEYLVLGQWLRQQSAPELVRLGSIEPIQPLLHRMGRHVLSVVWPEGRAAVLPEADYLSFDYPDGRTMVLPFRITAELTGLTPVPDILPTLYPVDGRPGPEVMATLERMHENMDLFEWIGARRSYSAVEWLQHMRDMAGVIRGLPPAEARSVLLAELDRDPAPWADRVREVIRITADRIGRADAVRLQVGHTTRFGSTAAEFTITWNGYAAGTFTDRGHPGKAEFMAAPGFFAVLGDRHWWARRASADYAALADRWIRLGAGEDWSSSVQARAFGVSIAEEFQPTALADLIRKVGVTPVRGGPEIEVNSDGHIEVGGNSDWGLRLDGRPPHDLRMVFAPVRGGRVLDPRDPAAVFADPHRYREPLWGGGRSLYVAIRIVATSVDGSELPLMVEGIRARAEVATVGAMPLRAQFGVTEPTRRSGHILLDSIQALDDTVDGPRNAERVNASMARMHEIGAIVHTHHEDGRINVDLSAPMNSALFLINVLTQQVAELTDRSADQVIGDLRAVLDETTTPSAVD